MKQKWTSLKEVYKETPVGLCIFDLDSRFTFTNKWIASKSGISVKKHLGLKPSDIFGPQAEVIENDIQEVISTEKPALYKIFKMALPTDPEKVRILEYSMQIIQSEKGLTVGVSAVCHDITDRDRIQRDNKQISNQYLIDQLTNRERDVLELIAIKLYDKEIGTRLSISTATVKWHLKRIYKKLGVHNRRKAADILKSIDT